MRKRRGPGRRVVVLVPLLLCAFSVARAQSTLTKIGQLDLGVGGLSASVTPAQPQIPKNIATGVQIVVTLNGQPLDANGVAQYLGGSFQIAGELSGPGLTQTIDVPQTRAPNSLILNLPALTADGNYTLSNLRFLVNGTDALDLSPSTVTVKVFDQEMSLEWGSVGRRDGSQVR